MLSRATQLSLRYGQRGFAGMGGAKPHKLGDKTHLETAVVAGGQFLNTANMALGAFCKKHHHEPVGLISDKNRQNYHEYSKDLHAQGAFKNEAATAKGIFASPHKGHFYKIESEVVRFEPEKNKLVLQDKELTYDHLILAPEFQFAWEKVENLEAALRDYWNSHVLSYAQEAFNKNIIRASVDFRGDNFLYVIPKSPHKNEGTHHFTYFYDELKKDQYIVAQWYKSRFIITTPETYIHRIPYVNDQLLSLAQARGIEVRYNLQLQKVNYNSVSDPHRIANAEFRNLKTGETEVFSYGQLVTNAEVKIPSVISPFADKTGFITVNPATLQHTKYQNVFALGECTNLPTINNSFAAMAQAHIVAANVGYHKAGAPLKGYYDGTSATPIFIGKGKLIMPGFNYNKEPVSTKLTTDTDSPLAGVKQMVSFFLFKRYEKKWFEKKLGGKIYGPPNWKKPGEVKKAEVKAKAAQ